MNYRRVYTDQESDSILQRLLAKTYEYHKPYQRFGKTVKVPRGQASFTLDKSIHYDYKVSGGSPPNEVMCPFLKEITGRVNTELGTGYNTILMNVYKGGKDCIGQHKDREDGWADGTGFATLSFGATRNFDLKEEDTGILTRVPHKSGYIIDLPRSMNTTHTHGVPPQPRVKQPRVSLTFRHIKAEFPIYSCSP